MKCVRALSAVVLVAASSAAPMADARAAEPLRAWDTAAVRPKGSGSIGLFAPLRISAKEGLELETHPLFFLVASPNVNLRVRLVDDGRLRLTGEYGLSVPTVAMRLTQGTLFPSWDTSSRRVGWFVVPSVGAALSYGTNHVATVRLDTAFGIGVGPNDATPLDTVAPLELAFAPALNGFRTRGGLAYDFPITTWLRGRVSFDAYYVGRAPDPPKSPFTFATSATLDVRVTARTRLTLGAVWYDHDQRRTVVRTRPDGFAERVGVRSDDVYPTGDFVWTW
ncbi:MAG: hypothetical protein U0169_02625 [Polyangiaceae bacterium]